MAKSKPAASAKAQPAKVARASRPSRNGSKSTAEVITKPRKRTPKTAEPLVDAAPKIMRPKLESGRFTMPKADFGRIATLKARVLALGRPSKKNELLRAGLSCLCELSDESLLLALDQLESTTVAKQVVAPVMRP